MNKEAIKIEFKSDMVLIENYPYSPSAASSGRINAFDVLEIGRIELRLKQKDIIYVPYACEKELANWAKLNSIPQLIRYDIWGSILEIFLDIELTSEDVDRNYAILEYNGIERKECDRYREKFEKIMYEYNFASGLWEWGHLGVTDLLDAHLGILTGERFKLSDHEFHKFYQEVIEIQWEAKIAKGSEEIE